MAFHLRAEVELNLGELAIGLSPSSSSDLLIYIDTARERCVCI